MLAELLSQLQEQHIDPANPTSGLTAALELSWNSLDESTQQIALILSVFAPAPIPGAMLAPIVHKVLDANLTQDAIAPTAPT